MEIPDIVRNAVKRFPTRTCVMEGSRSLTFAETEARASTLVGAIQAAGLRRGDRVALLAENELEYLEIQVAAMRAGVILVPLNYRLATPELEYILKDCTPRLLIHGPGYENVAADLAVDQTWHLGDEGYGEPYDEVLSAVVGSDVVDVPLLRDGDAASILYTSGTTGRPKGAIISNGALHARINMFTLEVKIRAGDTFVQALPMFHIASNMSYAFAYMGATNVMVRGFDPPGVLGLMEDLDASHVMLVPTMINMISSEPTVADTDLSALRMILYGASPISPEVLRRAIGAFGCEFLQFYGMTETAGCSLLRPADHDPDTHPERLSSAGTDSLSFETRVVDESDGIVQDYQVGEIICRGPAVMDGYWNAPEATVDALRNGWMHTGDLGYRSQDGYLFVSDRLKDMIVSGGENIYPREIEDVIYEAPGVLEAAVIGVPDRQWGEAVHALVVPHDEAVLDVAALDAHCRERLAGYKVPKSFRVVDTLAKNAIGKILKRVLREQYSGSESF